MQQPSAVESFFKFLLGFLIFISISFGVTVAVSGLAQKQDANQTAAAALAHMLEQIQQ